MNGTPVLDLYSRWGGTHAAACALGFMAASDGIHPLAAGYLDEATALAALLTSG